MNVLFVGGANTRLTPIAEALLRARLRRDARADVEVSSAGLSAINGSPIDPATCERALEEALDLSGHRARLLDASLLSWADRLVCLEPSHLRGLAGRTGGAAMPCVLLGESSAPECAPGTPRGFAPIDPRDEAAWGCGLARLRAGIETLYRELPAAAPEVYARAVEALFRGRTGGSLSLAPADWEQIDRWWSAGVPLWIVLDSLRDSMRRTARRGDARRMRRLRYCASDVKERYAAWTRAQAGGAAARPAGAPEASTAERAGADETRAPEDPARALRASAETVLRDAVRRAQAQGRKALALLLDEALRDAQDGPDGGDLAGERLRLHAIDDRIASSLASVAGEELAAAEQAEAETQIAAHRERMTPEAFARTVQRLAQRRLRERLGVPDLPS